MRMSVLIVNKLPSVIILLSHDSDVTRSCDLHCSYISNLPTLHKQFPCSSGSGSMSLHCPVLNTASTHLTPSNVST